jgi:cytochrome c-type biogenesis protein CcmE
MHAKLFIAGAILLAAIGYLAFAGLKSGWVYYMDVDDFLADTQYHTQRVRLHGTVSTDDFQANPGLLRASFNLMGETGQVPVVYQGVIPDLFQAGTDVVVEGRFDESEIFQANVLMTKCASKYEPVSPHAETE